MKGPAKMLLGCLMLLTAAPGVGTAVLDACGAKFLVTSRAASRDRLLLASAAPARILVYWPEDGDRTAQRPWDPRVTEALEKHGHTVTLTKTSEAFLDVVRRGECQVALMVLADAKKMAAELTSSPRCALLPVLYFSTRRELSDARDEFGNALKADTNERDLLLAVERSRQTSEAREQG